ncbi:MAG TPA: AI-2E family transporter [Candidatus Limnocylindria bacterium]|nr:AI-2E family transporter [Candidatus Limnocylindria bacterium]
MTVRVALVLIGLALALALAWELRQLIILAFLAALLAAALHGPSLAIERHGLGRTAAVVVTYLVVVAVLAVVVALIFPPLVQQAVQLVDDLPDLFGRLRESSIELISGIAGAGTGERVIDSLTQGARQLLPQVTSLLRVPVTVVAIVVNVVVVFVLSALMLLERDDARGWFMQFLDRDDGELVHSVARNALHKLGAYVGGQLLLMTVIGIGTGLGMVIVGFFTQGSPLSFLFPLALLAFVTEAIPMVGPFISGVPIAAVAFLESPLTGVLMGIWLIALQQLEGLILVPVVQSRAVALSPMIVLLAVLAGGTLAGIVGAIVAIPAVAVADVIIRDVVLPLRRHREERALIAEPPGEPTDVEPTPVESVSLEEGD